jgi:hypothetical protein
MTDLLFLLLGFSFGCMVMLNYKTHQQNLKFDDLTADMRKELDFYKNTAKSQRFDIEFLHKEVASWKKRYNDLRLDTGNTRH